MSARDNDDRVIGFTQQCINTGKWGGFIGDPDHDREGARFVGVFRSHKEAAKAVFLALTPARGTA